MGFYKYIFSILVYRNFSDLQECISSIQERCTSFKIVVVNAYYDEESLHIIKEIASCNECDFINVENKGYGFGNNVAIDFIIKNYQYNYIIISNPDIVIKTFDTSLLNKNKFDIIAPKIIALNGRNQNPMYINKLIISEYLEYHGLKNRYNILVMLGLLFSKIVNNIYRIFLKKNRMNRIYAAHGSFVILSKKAIEALHPIYDENMFLFAEEMVLATKAKLYNIKTYYYDGIHINHKEDGSMRLSNLKLYDELRKSIMYYYEHYMNIK